MIREIVKRFFSWVGAWRGFNFRNEFGWHRFRVQGKGVTRLQKSAWMEEAMSEEGHEENRQKDRQQDLLSNFLYACGAHGNRT